MRPGSEEWQDVRVRNLAPADLAAVIELDAKITGRRRSEYFETKLAQALHETGVRVSLAAEADGTFAGFLLARVWYGEFGAPEPFAVLDTLGVHPAFARRGVGRALLGQLRVNLFALGIRSLHTEVAWADQALLAFFQHAGFQPAPRFCLDLDLRAAAAQR
jgi:ribosomal protein S18 acetylase RimI-like enzyme